MFRFHGVGQDMFYPGLIVGDHFRTGVFQEQGPALTNDGGDACFFGDGFVG